MKHFLKSTSYILANLHQARARVDDSFQTPVKTALQCLWIVAVTETLFVSKVYVTCDRDSRHAFHSGQSICTLYTWILACLVSLNI